MLYFLRLITWFVSNCLAPSGRDEYVAKMQKDSRVDVYGQCSENPALTYGSTEEKNTLSQYKFYLAFENSNCKDYITEKFFVNGLG